MENNICNSMILTSRRRHFYLVGQSKHKVEACGVNNQASAVLAGNELPFVAFSHDEAHFWLNGYVNKQNCRIWSEANPQVYVETPLHPEKLTVWCALWAGGILLQKR
ncbi:hypothetical protein TNCV_2296841 [Trichonephila clavipes]|nr:hypothetical protein TNCV_2296841 [Trichonephila clavipes]